MTEESIFEIKGMHCTSCSKLIEMTLKNKEGVDSISVDYEAGKGRIRFDPAVLSRAEIATVARELGYEATFRV
ncbi:MAG: heavy-metal-associated domain-containing protein [Actinobacteria bacterium]|nr:heavy-metal-associated domain-containing protein [Actinomycetota bacterium]